jgi:hypothetical protein
MKRYHAANQNDFPGCMKDAARPWRVWDEARNRFVGSYETKKQANDAASAKNRKESV